MKNFKLFKLLALLVVLIGSINTAWANKTYSAGDVLYYDFTNIPSGGVNYTDENGDWHYSSTSYGKVVTITFTKSVTFKVGDTFAKTEYNGWDNINFSWRDPGTGNNCIVFKSDDSGYDWTTYGGGGSTYTVTYNGNGKSSGSVPTDATEYDSGDAVTVAGNTGNMTKSGYVFAGWNTAANGTGTYYAPGATFSITAATTLYAVWFDNNVLSGTNVMFYYQGYCDGNCTNRLVKSQNNPLAGSTDLGSGYGYANAATDDLDEYYYVSNNVSGWGGKANEGIKSAQGGELFVTNNSVTTTAAKTAATTANVVGESLSLSTTCNSATGVYSDKPLYILYYVGSNLISVTHSASTVLAIPASTSAQASTYNVSGLSNGSHTLKTILTDGLIYYIADTDNFDVAHTYSVTLNDNNGGSNNGSATVTYGDAALTVSSHASRAGWNLVGYWTGSGVSGSQVADAAGNLIASVSTWTDENGKWIKADNATIYAHWNQTNSLTVSAGTHVTTVSGSTSPVTLGNSYPISATAFDTGWEFYNWTASPVGNASFTSSTSSSTNVTVSNGSVTVTANAKEIARTVTISSDATKGSVSPSSVTAYISTKSDAIEATPEADFDFNGWSTGGGASIADGYTTSSNPVKVNATADGTLTATFIENVASGWYLGGTDFGNSWDESNTAYPLNKKYRGMEGVFYRQGTVTTSGYDCLHNGSTRYRPSTENPKFAGAGWSNRISLNSTTANSNYMFKTAGTYYIIADTRGATPVIWYETTEPDRFNYHSVNVTGVENAKGTCKVTLGSTSGFETTKFANGETFYVTITGVSGYIPTITIGGTPTTWWKEASTYTASGTMSTSDIAVTISYTASYAVTFATTTGGSTLTATGPSSTITTGTKVKSGTEIEFTQEPAAGYDFSSWNSASTGDGSDLGGDKDGLTKEITAATYVYPIYSFHTYTGGTLDKKEGSKDGTYSVTYYATSFASKTAPTRTGYSVEGYYKETERTNKVANADGSLNPNKTYTDGSSRWTYTSSIPTLYTQWQANTHDVTLNMNGSYTSNGTATSTYDATSLSSIVAPQRTGYDVEGYYTSAGCATKVADPEGALVANIDGYTGAGGIWTIDDDATLYANWTAITYTITYHLNSGSNPDGAPTSFTIESSLVTLPTPTRTGYNFGGWYTNSGLTGDPVASIAAGSTGNKEYWAKWTAKTTTVTLDQQSGSGGSGSVTATYGSAMPAATMPTYTGYDFGGYYTGTSGSGTQYYTSGGASARSWNFEDATKTLYAKWTAHDYTITYHLNGGTGATNTTYTILSSLITLPTAPTVNKTGYTFGGWYDNSSFTGSAVTSIAAGSTGNKEYWAMWTEKKVSIEPTVNATGDAQGYTASATVGSIGIATTTVLTADAPGEGYRFSGWTLSANLVITNGSVTDRSITVRTNGDGEAVSARADYEIDTYVRIYFRNTGSWGTVKAYVWDSSDEDDKNAAWPGKATDTETICGITYNYYEFDREDNPNWDKIIFNNDDNGKQTSDLDIAGHNGLSYKFSDSKWYVPTNTFYFVNTEFWDEVKLYHFGGTNGEYLGSWPGSAMDKIGTVTIDGHEYDYYGVADGICSNLDGSYIINNGKDGSSKKQTSNISSISNHLGEFFVANKCFGASSSPSDSDKPSGSWYDAVAVYSATIGCPALLPFADINEISLSADRVPPGASITATPDMNHKRDVDQAYCWGVYTDAACTIPVSGISFNSLGAGKVQFTVPEAEATYYLKLTVRASAACNAAIDDEEVQSFQVTTSNMVFFNNSAVNWPSVYVYFLGDTKYWSDENKGSGCKDRDYGRANQMHRIGKSDIYFYEYSGNALGSNDVQFIAFTDYGKPNATDFAYVKAAYRGDFARGCAPMYVPENWVTDYLNYSKYYNRGYWTTYGVNGVSRNSGFTLKIFNAYDGGSQVASETLSNTDGSNTYRATVNLSNVNYSYGYQLLSCANNYYGNDGVMNAHVSSDWKFEPDKHRCGLDSKAAGAYTFIVQCTDGGEVRVSVEYPLMDGDYRLMYNDTCIYQAHAHPSQFIRQNYSDVTVKLDTVSMYIRPDKQPVLTIQRCTNASATPLPEWENVGTYDVSGLTNGHRVYNFYISQEDGNLTINGVSPYTGSYYVRTQQLDGGWYSYEGNKDNVLTYTEYAEQKNYGFNYYKAKWVGTTGADVTFTIANDYSESLCDTMVADPGNNPLTAAEARNLPHTASVRFGWNSKTNTLHRAYINGSSIVSDRYLVMIGDEKMKDKDGKALTEAGGGKVSGLGDYEMNFTDINNWIYRADITAVEGAAVKLTANYDSHPQYFIGKADESEEIIGGNSGKEYLMRVTYDFKTNRLMTAWLPDGGEIENNVTLNADMMLIRKGQNAATQVYFNNNGKSISEIHTIFGVMEFQYDSIVGKFPTWGSPNAYKYLMYYISFPFDVKVSEIFGCGVRGDNWIIQKYNGAKRAQIGWFAETSTFWETMEGSETMNAYEGYLLLLDRISFNDGGSKVWENLKSGNSVYLYFPSASKASGTISEDETTIHVPEHTCTIDRTFDVGGVGTVSHKNTDSHWNVIGTPLFENDTATSIATPSADGAGATTLQYYYGWNSATNTLAVRSALNSKTVFKSMHSYMVQYAGDVTFNGAKLTPPTSVAARRIPGEKKNYQIELQMVNEIGMSSETFVELRENACDTFALNEDMYMMRSSTTVDLYTFAGNYDVAANVLSMNNHIVPVGMDVKRAGTYRFTMPSDFSGTVTLIDNEADARTNLAYGDYEVNLPKGTSNNRFFLEINIQQMPTAIDGAGGSLKDGKAHKFIENGQMYILQNGIIYDARGNRVR